MSSAYEKVQTLGHDIYTQVEYATKVIQETNKQEVHNTLFPENPLKKAGLNLWEGFKRFGSALKSGFNTTSSAAKAIYGAAITVIKIVKYVQHQVEKVHKLNAREEALQKAAEQHQVETKAIEQGNLNLAAQAKANAQAQEALAQVVLNESEMKERLAAEDSNAVLENATWTCGRGVEAAVDACYTAANVAQSGAYVASSAWHATNSIASNTKEVFTKALAKINQHYASQAKAGAAVAPANAHSPAQQPVQLVQAQLQNQVQLQMQKAKNENAELAQFKNDNEMGPNDMGSNVIALRA